VVHFDFQTVNLHFLLLVNRWALFAKKFALLDLWFFATLALFRREHCDLENLRPSA